MPDTAAFKARLEAELEELEARQARIADDLAEPLNADSGEQAVEMEDDASLEGQGALVSKEIASVKRALARIADGTFLNPSDGGCDGSVKAIEKWKGWLKAGYTSSTDALKPK